MVPTTKIHTMIVPQTVTNAGTLEGWVDTKGFDFATINLISETVDATDIPTVMRLGQADSTPTAFTDTTAITNFVGGTATSTSVGFVIPTPVTTTDSGVNVYSTQFRVDLRGRQRYLAIQFSPITTHTLSVNCNLSRGEISPEAAGTNSSFALALVSG